MRLLVDNGRRYDTIRVGLMEDWGESLSDIELRRIQYGETRWGLSRLGERPLETLMLPSHVKSMTRAQNGRTSEELSWQQTICVKLPSLGLNYAEQTAQATQS